MSGIYSMSGPTYRGATRQEMFDAAMAQPLSITSTLLDQAKGGILQTYGIGTAIKDFITPEVAPSGQRLKIATDAEGYGTGYRLEKPEELAAARAKMGAYDEDQYKASPYFRKDIPYDPGMTEQRAAALASMNDAQKVREHYAQKRPISAFIGNLAGQAFDPINYVPIAGPAVRAAAVAKAGRVAGTAATASLDAAANTAIFGIGTAGERAKFGDDVSWQSTVSQIATAAMIGSAFGAIGGAVGGRVDARRVAEAESRLATLKTTQEARIALNEGIDALVRGEDINLSPNATEPMARIQQEIIAYHGSPHSFDQFDISKIGTGEGAQAYGHGLYFAESEGVARSYRDNLSGGIKYQGKDADFVQVTDDRSMGLANVFKRIKELGESAEEAIAAVRQTIADRIPSLEKALANPDRSSAVKDQYRLQLENARAALGGMDKIRASDFEMPAGSMYEVRIKADPEHFLDWDKPLSEQSAEVQKALGFNNRPRDYDYEATLRPGTPEAAEYERMMDSHIGSPGVPDVTGADYYRSDVLRQSVADEAAMTKGLLDRGILGIKYLDRGSRVGGEGSRNYVVFDDSRVRIAAKNGVAVDTTAARPDPAPEGIKQAEAAVAKPDDAKALAAQYRVDPQTGSFHEEAEVAQLAAEGRLTETDVATMAQAQSDFETGAAYAEALRAVSGCLI